jgi:hypothetical protein
VTDQLDVFGGSVPVEELELRGHTARLAAAERERGHTLTADEAGALVHAAQGKHPDDARCSWCCPDGTSALIQLNTRRHQLAEKARAAREDPSWECLDCGHTNPASATAFCRACATVRGQQPEPRVSIDPATAPFPEGF